MNTTEHHMGCGCPACKNNMQNIDGYASGMELAPNQELSPELMVDPNFISSIVQQVLQQMNLGENEMEEQLDPTLADLNKFSHEPIQPSGTSGPSNPVDFNNPVNNFAQAIGTYVDPCGGTIHAKPAKDNEFKFPTTGGPVTTGGPKEPIGQDVQFQYSESDTNEGKIKKYIENQVRNLFYNIDPKVNKQTVKNTYDIDGDGIDDMTPGTGMEEGSCGYGPNGNPGSTPGETNGMQAQRRTSQMRNVNEDGPGAGEMGSTQTLRTYKGSKKVYKREA